ncbi:ribonuclease P protein component [Candidatus Peregrinibacteria bacterium]|nr:ribonuclease P protein component [Candidatus Peregrinibacteria bacterium]
MLPSQFRLKKTNNIEYILKRGKLFQSPIFLAKYVPNRTENHKFCVITSQKLEKSAVKRNRVRRQIYEALRLSLPKISPSHHDDCIIIPKKSIFETDFQKISHEINFLLQYLQ